MAETRVVNLEVNDNTKSLKAQLKEAQAEVQTLADKYGATSQQAIEAAKRAAILKDKIGDAKALTDAYNPDAKFKGLAGALTGVAGGFQAVQGAMGLLGAESEDVQKAMLKVQSAMALTSGLNTLMDAGDSFKTLGKQAVSAFNSIKTAIGTSGIGAILLIVGAIAVYWDDIKAAVSGVSKEQREYQKQLEDEVAKQKEKLEDLDKQDNILKLQGKTEKQIAELKVQQINSAITAAKALLASQKSTLKAEIEGEARNKRILTGLLQWLTAPIQLILGTIDYISQGLKSLGIIDQALNLRENVNDMVTDFIFDPEAVKENGEKTIKETEDALKELEDKRAGYELKIKDIDKSAAAERKKIADEAAAALLKKQEEEAAALRKLQEEQNKLIKDDQERELKQNAQKYQNLIEDLKKGKKELNDTDRALIATYEAQKLQDEAEINKKYDKIRSDHDAKVLADMQAADKAQLDAYFLGEQIKIDAMKDGYDKQAALRMLAFNKEAADLQAKLDAGLISQEQYNQANVNLSNKLNDDLRALRLSDLQDEKAKLEQKQAIQQRNMDIGLQGVQLLKDVFGKSKAVQKGAVLVESAVAIAKMIQANNLANIGALATPQAIASSGAAAAPVIAANNIQTGIGIAANIAATAKALKAIGSGGSVDAPNTTAAGAGGGGRSGSMAPDFNVVGNNNINQLAQLQQQPIKAYVVGAEVTTQQSLDRNRLKTGQL